MQAVVCHQSTSICICLLVLLSSASLFLSPPSASAKTTAMDSRRTTLRRSGSSSSSSLTLTYTSSSPQLKLVPRRSSAAVQRWSPPQSDVVDPRRRPTSGTHCVRIPDEFRLCRNIGYPMMRLPNILEHDSIEETIQQSMAWIHLRDVNCHPDTQLFLCSLFSPVCLEQLILPCRSLCEAVRHGCEPRMQRYGFSWPEMLQCDRFPVNEDLCISMQSTRRTQRPEAMVVRVIEASATVSRDLELVVAAKKKNVFRTGSHGKKEILESLKALPLRIPNGAECKCTRNIMTSLTSKVQYVTALTSSNDTYLTMGHRDNDGQLIVTYFRKIDRKSREMRRALRSIAEDSECRNGRDVIQTVTADVDDVESRRSFLPSLPLSVIVIASSNATSIELETARPLASTIRRKHWSGAVGNGTEARNRNRSTPRDASSSPSNHRTVIALPYFVYPGVTNERRGNITDKSARTRAYQSPTDVRTGANRLGDLLTSSGKGRARKLSSRAAGRRLAVAQRVGN